MVEGGLADYYGTVVDYIHLNPARAGLVRGTDGDSLLDFPWSSVAGGYALAPGQRPRWLAAAHGLEVLGYPDTVAGRRRMVADLDRRALEEGDRSGLVPLPDEADARMSHLRRGWYWGRQEFGEKLRRMLGGRMDAPVSRAYQRTPERMAHGLERAEELIAWSLAILALSEEELRGLRGGDPRRVELARLIRQETTVSLGWIATRVGLKSAANVSQQLRTKAWKDQRTKIPREFRGFLERRGRSDP